MTRVGYWDINLGASGYGVTNNVEVSANLDVQSLVSDFVKGMHKKEDAVLEPIVVDWLRGGGWTVERRTDDKITALTEAWYAYVNLDHHKDRDCHFYIEKVWSYGNSPIYRVSHPGYITDFVSHDFQASAEAHRWLYRTLWSRCKDALENLQTPDSFPFHGDDDSAARVIKALESALAV